MRNPGRVVAGVSGPVLADGTDVHRRGGGTDGVSYTVDNRVSVQEANRESVADGHRLSRRDRSPFGDAAVAIVAFGFLPAAERFPPVHDVAVVHNGCDGKLQLAARR